jgi:hypothetical protein
MHLEISERLGGGLGEELSSSGQAGGVWGGCSADDGPGEGADKKVLPPLTKKEAPGGAAAAAVECWRPEAVGQLT